MATGNAVSERRTREALMEAALHLLQRDGVLAGLNISEVAKEVGVTPANVYHYFHSRQGLLRAAISHRIATLAAEGAEAAAGDDSENGAQRWHQRARSAFDFVSSSPELAMAALLALDGDTEFKLAPLLDEVRAIIERDRKEGYLVDDVDAEVLHMLFNAAAFGCTIFSASGARQLGLSEEEFSRRAQAVFDRVALVFVPKDKLSG